MILELHERDAKVLEQILSILKNHPEIEKFEIDEEPMVSLPGLELFPSRRKVFRDRQEIQLTAKEYRILLLLATNKGRVLTYAQIYEQVWGDFTTGNENNTIGFHICNLREKLYRASRPHQGWTEHGALSARPFPKYFERCFPRSRTHTCIDSRSRPPPDSARCRRSW